MKQIGLLSDTHGYFDEKVFEYFKDCDEIWHAGDFGNMEIVNKLKAIKPLRGVYGNIDGNEIRSEFPEDLIFNSEDVKVFMKHIGGYPGRYAPGVKNKIIFEKPQLFISGHSHILKIVYDDKLQCLHINPGAAGKEGWHKVKTIILFDIDGSEIKNCRVVELGKR